MNIEWKPVSSKTTDIYAAVEDYRIIVSKPAGSGAYLYLVRRMLKSDAGDILDVQPRGGGAGPSQEEAQQKALDLLPTRLRDTVK